MSETLVLRMPEGSRPATWIVVDAFGNRMGEPASGALAEAAAAVRGRRLRVCVPGAQAILLYADLPTHNSRKIQQAVPFALEDKLAEDIDTLHFALGPRDRHGYPAVVVTRAHMREWLEQLAAAGLTPAELVVDVLTLPVREHSLTLVPDGEQVLVRFSDGSGMAVDRMLAPLLVRRQIASLPEPLRCSHALVYAADESAQQQAAGLLTGLNLEIAFSHLRTGAIGLMAGGPRAPQAINLLQGEFGRHVGAAEYWLHWRVAVWLLAALVGVFILQQGVTEFRLRRQWTAQQAQIAALFHQALPDVTRMVEPRVQMQRRLSHLTGGTGNANGLLPMLASVGTALQSQSGMQLQGFSYHAGVLQLQIQAPNIAALDSLKAALAQTSGIQAELDSVSSTSGQTTGRLTLRGSGP